MATSDGDSSRADAPTHCPVCERSRPSYFVRADGRDYWRCPGCEATFVAPGQRPDRDAERREYDLHRNDIDDPGYRGFLGRLVEPLLERIPASASGLDYGCGPGPALAAMLREAGLTMRVWDPIYRPDRSPLRRTYDVVTCTEVVEHMHRPAAEFRRLDRLLRPGGWLGVMTGFQTDDARFANWHYRRDPTHVVFYRAETLTVVAERLGWSIDIPRAGVAIFRKPGVAIAPPMSAG